MPYIIQISAQQQRIITAALAAYATPGPTEYNGQDDDESKVLLSLFSHLPQDAASLNDPSVVHSFIA